MSLRDPQQTIHHSSTISRTNFKPVTLDMADIKRMKTIVSYRENSLPY